MPDELDRWAAGRVPDLLARAEAEAVEELKRALLKAALARERPQPAPPPPPEPARPAPAPTGDGLWAYCITRASDPP